MPFKMGDGFAVKILTDFGAFHHEFMFGLGARPLGWLRANGPYAAECALGPQWSPVHRQSIGLGCLARGGGAAITSRAGPH